ncbi:WXG100 family type VII secretion target [Streptomyces sp. 21So2-11]|uniref:WXG100 family type VII secretion target n=1 Tax=Streptomyces sp. 21So2-11 TaxID=3144408 RepID=UPI003219EFBE
MDEPRLRASHDRLTDLANDLDDMQGYLNNQVKRMDEVVDSIEAGWRGPAADAYRSLHRDAAKDAVRIREVMKTLAQAVRLSRDGFTEQELDVLERFRRLQGSIDVDAEADALSTPHTLAGVPAPPKPHSGLSDL